MIRLYRIAQTNNRLGAFQSRAYIERHYSIPDPLTRQVNHNSSSRIPDIQPQEVYLYSNVLLRRESTRAQQQMGIFVVTFKALTEYYLYMSVVYIYHLRAVIQSSCSRWVCFCGYWVLRAYKSWSCITAGHFPTSNCQCDIKEFVVRFFFLSFSKSPRNKLNECVCVYRLKWDPAFCTMLFIVLFFCPF